MKENYQKEYKDFISAFHERPISGEEVGMLISTMAYYYGEYNLAMVDALRDFNKVSKECEAEIVDGGKAISSTKAQVNAAATPEAHQYQTARAHVLNLEQIINALKALQRGVIVEFNNANV